MIPVFARLHILCENMRRCEIIALPSKIQIQCLEKNVKILLVPQISHRLTDR